MIRKTPTALLRQRPRLFPTLLALAAACTAAAPARAQGLLVAQPPPTQTARPVPRPVPRPLPIRAQKVALTVESGAVKAQVSQVFQNTTSTPLEGTYLFNLPPGAAVANFRMQVDKEPVDGKMLTVEEARRIYETFVRQQVDPGILEYAGNNAFRARVFPIPGNSDKEIQIGYSHPASFQNGLYQVTYPLNTEKASPEPLRELSIQCALHSRQPIKAIYSPTHEIQVKRENDHDATITFEAKEIRANRDFVLYYSVSEKEFGLNALANRKAGEDGTLMLMLAPQREAAASQVLPKDVVFVFDTSGSMQGAKIEQAKRALTTVLGALGAKDRFNIVRFSTETASFRPGVVDATADNVKGAQAFVADFKAVGGTAIDDALQAGFASLPAAGGEPRSRFVIFMTDGLPTIGQTSPDQILANAAKANQSKARVFSFGVGNDVNAILLDRLALNGSGAADYVSPDEDLETKIGSFYTKIANPVLSNVRIEVDGAQVSETYPKQLPDLFAGTQLLVLGRYKGDGKATVKVTGELGGVTKTFTYDATLPREEKEHSFIPKLWASRKIGHLLEEIRLKGENAELKDEVVRLSKEHGILTPYTAFLVEEPGARPVAGAPLTTLGAVARGDRGRGFDAGAFGRPGGGPANAGGAGGRGGAVPADRAAGQTESRYSVAPARNPSQPASPAATPPVAAGVEAQRQERLAKATNRDYFFRSTGGEAIDQSRRLQRLKEQVRDEVEVESLREVEGRKFQLQEGIWQETPQSGKPAVVTVKFGSDAYFQLLRQNPAWTKFMALGKNVVFRSGKTHLVKVSETSGKEKLTAAELKSLTE